MRIVDRYIFRHTLMATVFVTVVLAALVFLMQSLKFIDLVMNAGASGFFIWLQTLLYLPGFLEIILPIGMVAGVLFVYNRLTMDSELIVLRALGFSPFRLARPALVLAIIFSIILFLNMGWVSPFSRQEATTLRQDMKAQMSSLIFREGIFNEAGSDLMVYIKERDEKGRLHGLVIHDSRDETKPPSSVIARSGVLVSTKSGQQVLVYDGSRQEVDPKTGVMRHLDFDQYTIDIPEPEKQQKEKWAGPDERTTPTLINSLRTPGADTKSERRQLRAELQKRFLLPFLVPGFALIGLSFLLIGNHDRRGQNRKVLTAVASVVLLEILFLGSYNLSKQSPAGLPFMVGTILLPYFIAIFTFSKENILRKTSEGKQL